MPDCKSGVSITTLRGTLQQQPMFYHDLSLRFYPPTWWSLINKGLFGRHISPAWGLNRYPARSVRGHYSSNASSLDEFSFRELAPRPRSYSCVPLTSPLTSIIQHLGLPSVNCLSGSPDVLYVPCMRQCESYSNDGRLNTDRAVGLSKKLRISMSQYDDKGADLLSIAAVTFATLSDINLLIFK